MQHKTASDPHLQSSIYVILLVTVLPNDPQSTRTHSGRPDLVVAVQQPLQNRRPQLAVGLHDLPYKEHHIQCTCRVGVTQEVHQQVDHTARYVRKLDRTAVNGLH